MKEGLNLVKVFHDCAVTENNDKETKITEITKFGDMADAYMRELVIQKDRKIITTWLKALGDKELLDVYDILKSIMDERNISK